MVAAAGSAAVRGALTPVCPGRRDRMAGSRCVPTTCPPRYRMQPTPGTLSDLFRSLDLTLTIRPVDDEEDGLGVHADPARRRDLRDRFGHVLRRRPGQQRRVGGGAHPVTGAVGARGRRRRGRRGRRRRARPDPRPRHGRSSATRRTRCSRSWTPPGSSSESAASSVRRRSSAADASAATTAQRHDQMATSVPVSAVTDAAASSTRSMVDSGRAASAPIDPSIGRGARARHPPRDASRHGRSTMSPGRPQPPAMR